MITVENTHARLVVGPIASHDENRIKDENIFKPGTNNVRPVYWHWVLTSDHVWAKNFRRSVLKTGIVKGPDSVDPMATVRDWADLSELTVPQVNDILERIDDVDLLRKWYGAETRSTAKEAIAKRLAELT